MVTIFDSGMADILRLIFTMIMIFVIMYGFLSWTKPFGKENQGLYSLVAFAFAILSIVNKGVLTLINFMTPWFFIVIFIGFFILFILMMFGLKEKDLTAGASPKLRTWVIIITVVILLFGFGTAFGQQTLEKGTGVTPSDDVSNVDSASTTGTSDFSTNLMNTLFNPKVLGMIVVLLVGAFSMFLLTTGQID